MSSENLLGLPETRLTEEPGVAEAVAGAVGYDVDEVLEATVKAHPTSSLAWATLADRAFSRGETLQAYAFARVGYHRGLDALRKAGWRGQGPVPWSHEPNRGVLLSLYLLRRAAEAIGETDEVTRLTEFLQGADPRAVAAIEAGER
ncbi:DUF3151 domain-containing protein [Herbiconiux flava]|uniref:DUF3151 domain-containing protein n=1 Tax=Herbiconiux flava TaxID=881268 RepID=A0A852SKP4_9MICO|nr:DUF3151 domain-containing protein [Herbiconiux flava]NYD68991.1 hypothetical protein [Herbiconiux flava]GLK15739.1 hypothetical protein GCM10017602_02210 [Herbiconiux flava]